MTVYKYFTRMDRLSYMIRNFKKVEKSIKSMITRSHLLTMYKISLIFRRDIKQIIIIDRFPV